MTTRQALWQKQFLTALRMFRIATLAGHMP